jgi:hypothetical protein
MSLRVKPVNSHDIFSEFLEPAMRSYYSILKNAGQNCEGIHISFSQSIQVLYISQVTRKKMSYVRIYILQFIKGFV